MMSDTPHTPDAPATRAATQHAAIAEALRIPDSLKAGGPGGRRRRVWPWLLGILIAVLAAALLLQPRRLAVGAATAAMVSPTQELVTLTATGYLVAQRRAAVASKASGRLVYLGVGEGSRVKAGDLLARLDARDVSAQFEAATANIAVAQGQLAQAQAELSDAKAAAQRTRDLVSRQFVSPASLDTAQAREQAAAARLESANAALRNARSLATAARAAVEETTLTAPFDGVVVNKSANVGDVITPFSNAIDAKGAVLTLADLSTLEAEVDVSESNLARVTIGQACELTLDALPDERYPGQVVSIVPAIDRAKATVKVKVRFDRLDDRFLPDMSVKVGFLSRPAQAEERSPRLMLPATAIRDGQVFRIDAEQVARAAPVQTGRQSNSLIEILSGVQAGDQVVNPIPADLRDGMRIEKATRR